MFTHVTMLTITICFNGFPLAVGLSTNTLEQGPRLGPLIFTGSHSALAIVSRCAACSRSLRGL